MKHPTDQIKEAWRCQASQNVESHELLTAIEDCVISSTNAGVGNIYPLLDFTEFRML